MLTKLDQQTIGAIEQISFPGLALENVPAKVDTGADSSSIWASDIREEDGKLHFKLFDRQSPFYTGKEIVSKSYRMKSIKNSFGHSEFRYKVPLSIVVKGRRLKTRFTLADRSRNNYPILIGRRTISNKFLVDVSRKDINANKLPNILVLARTGNQAMREQFAALRQTLNGQAEIDIVRYDQLVTVTDSAKTVITVGLNGRDVSSYNQILFFTRARDSYMAAMVASYAQRFGITYFDKAAMLTAADAKAHQALLLGEAGMQIPRTIYMDKSKWDDYYDQLVELLGSLFIFKDNRGKKGRNNFLINSAKEFGQAVQLVNGQDLQMIAQAYVPNDGYYRLLVLGCDVVLAMYRSVGKSGKGDKSHLHSKADDGAAKAVEISSIPTAVQQMAINSARALSLDIAGVDILQDNQTAEWYCLEVNNSPQLVGGALVNEKMNALGKFFIKESRK